MLSERLSRRSWLWIGSAALLASVVAYCAPPGTFRKIDFDFSGAVRDSETKEPIEGAYVVAIYYELASGPAASTTSCIKTRGMYAGKDGRFSFRVEKLNNLSPGDVVAIKPEYYGNKRTIPSSRLQDAQTLATYSGRDVILTKQAANKPVFSFGTTDIYCDRAQSREDAAAAIEFLKLKLKEYERLGRELQIREDVADAILSLERLPARPNK